LSALANVQNALIESDTRGNATHQAPLSARPARRESVPAPGELIGGTYRVVAEIGEGAAGLVLLGVDQRLERKVAIKLLDVPQREAPTPARFPSDARAMAHVRHPRVASVFAFGDHYGVPYFVMEFVEGGTVADWLADAGRYPSLEQALRIADDLCLGVSAIHAAGALHRDIKPTNLLLDAELRACVSDFGLSVCSLEQEEPPVSENPGKLAYTAPELVFEADTLTLATEQSDVYSLGCVVYELLTGRPPFLGETFLAAMLQHATEMPLPPSVARPGVSPLYDGPLLRALAKWPEERMQTVEELRVALERARKRCLDPLRILIAEQDPDLSESLCRKLTTQFPEAEIECVADGEAAVRAFDLHPASVVLLDLELRDLDGVGITAQLRAREEAAEVPIIVLTASGGPAEWQLMCALGADRFLARPVDLDEVVNAIHDALGDGRNRSDVPRQGAS